MKKILLVDDVRLFLKLQETFFKRTGCEILTAESGSEAIEVASKSQPDLILLDYIMPDMKGDEVTKRLKANDKTKSIPIMIVSTSANDDDIKKCFDAGAQEYVTKPIKAQEVLAKAAYLLAIPHRVHYRVAVTLKVEGKSGESTFAGVSLNISRGGVLVDCKERIPLHELVSLYLPIKSGQEILQFKGEVVRSEKAPNSESYLLGVQFTEVSPDQETALADFMKDRVPIPEKA